MPTIDVVRESKAPNSVRARQVASLFDCPMDSERRLEWKGDIPTEDENWQIGLIVGPSGSGKTTIARELWPEDYDQKFDWSGDCVIDDFDKDTPIAEIASALNSVGFNTIPAWLRPYNVLSTGEQFRVNIARTYMESTHDPIVLDEFTSVVDRQVAKVACHSVQKFVRKQERKLVAVSCHYDVIEWLQPDWVFEPASMKFARRSVQRRPSIEVEVKRVPWDTWRLFSPFHYMTAELNRAAKCFALFIEDRPVAFTGIFKFPHPKRKNLQRCSRLVTLPDWQGLGLSFILIERLAQAYKAIGEDVRCYPAHSAFIGSFARIEKWRQVVAGGTMNVTAKGGKLGLFKQRASATFEWRGGCGEIDRGMADRLINTKPEPVGGKVR